MLGLAVVSMSINGNPIGRLAAVVGPVRVSFVMCDMNAVVKNLAESDGDRFQNAEQPIEQGKAEVGIVNEVVRDAVDVPGNAHRIDEAENGHHPKRQHREEKEHSEEIRAMQERGGDRNKVPASVGENS